MKIMIANDSPTAMYFIRLGWARAFTSCGHEVVMWDINKKNAYDAFDEFSPDLFIGQTYNVNESIKNCIRERPNLKVIMKAGDWGPFYDDFDGKKYPILQATEKEKRDVLELFEETQRPNFVYVHYREHRLDDTHGYWIENGIRVESMLNAADIFEFTNGQVKPEYETDIAWLGAYWSYKAINLDKYIIPLCDINSGIKIKIFGNQPWPVPQYCGFAPAEETRHILKSATICPNVHEPHSTDFGFDIVERPFKLLSNKCFCISDFVEDLAALFPDSIVHATCPDDFQDKIRYYLKNPDKRLDFIERGYYNVMRGHTYHHRVAHMLDKLGLEEESKNVLEKYEEIRKKIDE